MPLSEMREEINNWIAFGFGLMDLVPGGVLALQTILALFPQDIQREWTPEKQREAVANWQAVREANKAERDKRRTEGP